MLTDYVGSTAALAYLQLGGMQTIIAAIFQFYNNFLEKMMKKPANKYYLDFNVILTFNKIGGIYGDSKEFLDIRIAVSELDLDPIVFLNKNLFPKIYKTYIKLKRPPKQLIKISTAANWDVFTKATNQRSLSDYGHSCKWYFGVERSDLDIWELVLMGKYGFGLGDNIHSGRCCH